MFSLTAADLKPRDERLLPKPTQVGCVSATAEGCL